MELKNKYWKEFVRILVSIFGYYISYLVIWSFLGWSFTIPRSFGWVNTVYFYSIIHVFISLLVALSGMFFVGKFRFFSLFVAVIGIVAMGLILQSDYPKRMWVICSSSFIGLSLGFVLFDRKQAFNYPH